MFLMSRSKVQIKLSMFQRLVISLTFLHLQASVSVLQWNSLYLQQTYLQLNSLPPPIPPLESSTCLVSLFGSWNWNWNWSHHFINFLFLFLFFYFIKLVRKVKESSQIRDWKLNHITHTHVASSKTKRREEDYFSLFNLDRSRSSLSRGDDLNLSSNSAYFFWFSSARWKLKSILSTQKSVEGKKKKKKKR